MKWIHAIVWPVLITMLVTTLALHSRQTQAPASTPMPISHAEVFIPKANAVVSLEPNAEVAQPTLTAEVPNPVAQTTIVNDTLATPTEAHTQSYWLNVLQAIIAQPTETAQEIMPAATFAPTNTPTATAIPTEVVKVDPTATYAYADGITPLYTPVGGGIIANVLPTQIANQDNKPPCDMNPIQYLKDHGSDALYDLADARDGKICAYTVVDFCPMDLEKPNADWQLNKKLQAQLSTEGTEDDVWIYGYNIISIANEAGATLSGVEPTDLIVLPEEEIDGLKIMLLLNSCSDSEGRFVLKSAGVYYLLDFLKSKVQ